MLDKKKKKCLELMASGELTQKEISGIIKISEQSICKWKKDKEFMKELDLLIKISISSLAAKALKTHGNLLNAKSEMVRYMVAKDILDRSGYKGDDKLKIEDKLQVVIVDNVGDDNN